MNVKNGCGEIVRNEIGSEFWGVPTCDKENSLFPSDVRWLISGTSALECILMDIQSTRKPDSVALPSWCCSCMIEPFVRLGLDIHFYTVCIGDGGGVVCDYSSVSPCDITLAITYFGYRQQTAIGRPSGVVIRDLTHALFSTPPTDADYCFGSLRKWAGFWTGGYAWKQGVWERGVEIPALDPSYLNLRKRAMEEKCQYLRGEREDKHYLNLFEMAEEYLDQTHIMSGCQRDIDLARQLDDMWMKQKRRENAAVLLERLHEYALFSKLAEDDCPMFVPLVLDTERRNGLRRYLIGQHIYCPIHWGLTELHQLTDAQRYLYDHVISIVCDQRYNTEDMERIVFHIRKYLKENV